MSETLMNPYQRVANLETSVSYLGSIMSFLANGKDTGGRFALMEFQLQPGNEPPPHIHDWEQEMYYVLEGVLEFYCEGKVLLVHPGEAAFLPHGKAHAFYCRSTYVRTLLLVVQAEDHSVDLDGYFAEMGTSAVTMDIPADSVTHLTGDPEHAIRVAAAHGVRILAPDQVAKALPHYPGFGIVRPLLQENKKSIPQPKA